MSEMQAARSESRPAGGGAAFQDHMARGRVLLDSGAFDAAEAAARRARDLAPQYATPVLLLAQIAQRRDGPAQRAEILAQSLEQFGDDVRIRRQLADALILTGAFAEALPHAEWLASRTAKEMRDHMMLARCLLELGESDRAETEARQAQDLAPEEAAPVLLLAQIALRRDGPARKAEILGQSLERFGDDIRIRRQLAAALMLTGAVSEALLHAEWLATRDTAEMRDHLLLARCLLGSGELDRAEAAVHVAQALEPDRGAPGEVLSQILRRITDPAQRAEMLTRYLNSIGGLAPSRLYMVETLLNLGLNTEARRTARSIDISPGDDRRLLWLSGLFELCQMPDLAEQCLSRIDRSGKYRRAVILSDVLNGRLDPAEALSSALNDNDAYRRVLLAYAAKQGDRGARAEIVTLAADPEALAAPYHAARAYTPLPEGDRPLVSIVAPIHRREDWDNLLQQLLRQDYPELEVLVVINGPGITVEEIRGPLEAQGHFRCVHVLHLPDDCGLPVALNAGLAAARGDYVARFDADDLYLDRYVSNTVGLMHRLGADVSGKPHLFMHLERLGCTLTFPIDGREYRLFGEGQEMFGSGSTLVVSQAVLQTLRYSELLASGEDRDFYSRARAAGFSTVFAPPWDHIVMRREDRTRHTWRLGELQLLTRLRAEDVLHLGPLEQFERTLERWTEDNNDLLER